MNTGFEQIPAEPVVLDDGCARRVPTANHPAAVVPVAATGISSAKVLAFAGGFGLLAGGGAIGFHSSTTGAVPPGGTSTGTAPPGTPPGSITGVTPPGGITQIGVPVPEPASIALFGVAIFALAASRVIFTGARRVR